MLLVTGGAGFIGSNFVLSTIAETGETVVNLDRLTYAGKWLLPRRSSRSAVINTLPRQYGRARCSTTPD